MNFRHQLKTGPTTEPLTLAEAKTHLRVTSSDDDTYIEDTLIVAARQHAELVTRRSFITQTWTLYADEFLDLFLLPRPPLVSVTHVKYIDDDGAQQTLDASVYSVDTVSAPGHVYLAYDQSWPSARPIRNAVEIEYVAGYGAAADVPLGLKQAMLLLIGHLYEHREAVNDFNVFSVPMGFDELLWPYRVLSF